MENVDRFLHSSLGLTLRTWLRSPEVLCAAVLVLAIELFGPHGRNDIDDILWVLMVPLLFMAGCSMMRYRPMPLTQTVIRWSVRAASWLRSRLVLSLGLDFHPTRHPRLQPFTGLRRTVMALALLALILLPAQGIGREVLEAARGTGTYTVYILALAAIWITLLAGVAVSVPASVLAVLEVVKSRFRLEGFARLGATMLVLGAVVLLLATLHAEVGLQGAVGVLAFACLLPSVVQAVEPPNAPWLNIALGHEGPACTTRLGRLLRDGYRTAALEGFLVAALLIPREPGSGFPVTDLLLALYAWSSAWLYTGSAMLAISEFNRRRRLFDPAFERSRVLWAVPGEEARALASERSTIEAAGWRLVVKDDLPGPEDADLLVGLPGGLMPPSRVPLARIPPALFLLSPDPTASLSEADERDKAERCREALERLLTSMRPRMSDRGEGTFLVPHCWLVVGLTRDDERGNVDRPPAMTFGQTFQSVLGTRLRRFMHEVSTRAGVDVYYIEDSVTPVQVGDVLERLFERHIQRADPGLVGEADFVGLQGVRVVLHDVDPETDGIAGVDAHVTRNAISRARILIISRDRRDDDDDDGPPVEGESTDLWLRESLRNMFPRLQPVG